MASRIVGCLLALLVVCGYTTEGRTEPAPELFLAHSNSRQRPSPLPLHRTLRRRIYAAKIALFDRAQQGGFASELIGAYVRPEQSSVQWANHYLGERSPVQVVSSTLTAAQRHATRLRSERRVQVAPYGHLDAAIRAAAIAILYDPRFSSDCEAEVIGDVVRFYESFQVDLPHHTELHYHLAKFRTAMALRHTVARECDRIEKQFTRGGVPHDDDAFCALRDRLQRNQEALAWVNGVEHERSTRNQPSTVLAVTNFQPIISHTESAAFAARLQMMSDELNLPMPRESAE